MKKFLWLGFCFALLYWRVDTVAEVTAAEGILYTILMIYLVKDEFIKAWKEIVCEEVE